MDENGYPTDEELEIIKNWELNGASLAESLAAIMTHIRPMWRYSDCGYWREEEGLYNIHTGGWSGNESLVGALMGNQTFWIIFWKQSEVGGHYIFATSEAWHNRKES